MGLDIKFIPEYKKNGPTDDWSYFNVSEGHEVYKLLKNRDYQIFALFGPKWDNEYKHYPTLPFLHDLPKQTEERFLINTFKYKYQSYSTRDVLENIEKYDISEEFALYYDPLSNAFVSTVYIDEAIAFDYDQIAVDGMTWRYLLDDWWFPIIEYFKKVGVEQVHISFGF